jgi:hypothetical protein
MTVSTFIATLTGEDGKYQGTIHWDKYKPRKLIATICRFVATHELDYPIWQATARYGIEGQRRLVKRLQTEAGKRGLQLIDGTETKYSPKD